MSDAILNILKSSKYATGIDISAHNDTFDLDVAEYASVMDIVDIIILRAGVGLQSGEVAEDAKFAEFYTELEQHPQALRGVYWYLSSHSSWQSQRDKFLNILKGKDVDLIVVDVEKYYNVSSRAFALDAVKMLQSVQSEYPNKRVMLYTGKYIYQDWLKPHTDAVDSWHLWHAQYGWSTWNVLPWLMDSLVAWITKLFGGTLKPSLPKSRGVDDWELWQVGDKTGLAKALGVGGTEVDINISRRTREEFITWVGRPIRWDLPIEPDPIPDPIQIPDPEITVVREGNDLHIHIHFQQE